VSTELVLYDEAGPRTRRRILIGSIAGGLLLLVLAFVVYRRLDTRGIFEAERWDIFTDPEVWEAIGRGLLATLKAAGAAAALAAVAGLVLCVLRTSPSPLVRRPAAVTIELFRGLPVVLLMFFAAVVLPVSLFWAVVIGLVIYNSAVVAEILRAGIASLPRGQTEAAAAIGLSDLQTLRLVLLPQAIRRMMPTLVSQLVVLNKDTSLGFIVGYFELLRTVQTLQFFFGDRYLFSFFFVAAGIYILLNVLISRLAIYLERRGSTKAAGGGVPRALAVVAAGTGENV